MRSLHHSYPNRNDPPLPVHPWSALGEPFQVRTQRDGRQIGASSIRCREFGGEWRVVVSDTAKPNRPNQRILYVRLYRA